MEPTRLRQRLESGSPLIGLAISYPAAGILETIGPLWDFFWIDGQHGQISQDAMLSLVRTADMLGVDTVVRVPGREAGVVGPYADMVPSALMIPMINTPGDAAAAVDAVRFPPLGCRSFGGRRPVDMMGRTFYRDKEPVVVAQIETARAVGNARAIAETEGIDVLMLGPDDLKIDMGMAISSPILETPALLDALKVVAEAASEAGKAAACITPTPEMAEHALALGYRLFIAGSDAHLLREGAARRAESLAAVLGRPAERKPAAGADGQALRDGLGAAHGLARANVRPRRARRLIRQRQLRRTPCRGQPDRQPGSTPRFPPGPASRRRRSVLASPRGGRSGRAQHLHPRRRNGDQPEQVPVEPVAGGLGLQ